MIWIKGESAFERHWSPGKLFVDCTTTTVPWLSAQPLPGGMPLGNESFIFMAVALKGSKKGGKRHKKKKKLFAQMYLLSASFLKHSPTYWCTSSMSIQKEKKSQHILSFMRSCDNWIPWDKAAGMHFHAFPCICSYRSFQMSETEKWTFCFVLSKVSGRQESFSNELKPLKSQTNTYWY